MLGSLKLLGFDRTGRRSDTTEKLSTARPLAFGADSLTAGTAVGDFVQGMPVKRLASSQGRGKIDDCRPAATRLRALLAEDDQSDVELFSHALWQGGIDVSSDVVQTVEEFSLRLQETSYDVILADYTLPQWKGMEALEILRHPSEDRQ